MTVKFTILGNQEDRQGNPIPKLKMTAGQHWMPQVKRYVAWKDYVRAAMLDADVQILNEEGITLLARDGRLKLQPYQQSVMSLIIHWANEKHGDPESIFGSIADAIFENDKHVAGHFYFEHATDKQGKVDVTIEIQDHK